MKTIEKSFLKVLFTSCLVVALVHVKENLEHVLKEHSTIITLILFFISLIFLALIEYLFERLFDMSWFRKLFFRKDFIEGWWLNHAVDGTSKDIYNFALIEIRMDDEKYLLNGRAFKVTVSDDPKRYHIIEDGHFHSTMSQYKNNGEFRFNFIITDSGKVAANKHEIFGKANYYFIKDGSIPAKFSGTFSTDSPYGFCSVNGNRLDDKFGRRDVGVVEDYRKIMEFAIQQKWIDIDQIKKLPDVNGA